MIISRNGRAGSPTQQRTDTFTGLVFADPVLQSGADVMVNNVYFAAGARTYWHSHERGQLLSVVSGSGLVGVSGGDIEELATGDVIWSGPGELHWHGAAPDAAVLHCAVSLGRTTWAEAVSDAEYRATSAR